LENEGMSANQALDRNLNTYETAAGWARAKRRGQFIFVGEYRFPNGDAAAVRTMSLARMFRDLGFAVTVVGKGQTNAVDFNPERNAYFTEGIKYLTMNPQPLTVLQRIANPISRMKIIATTLASMDLDNCRAIVINASDSARHVPFVQSFCRQRSIPLIGDVCEWYDSRQMNAGIMNPFYLIFCVVFHLFIPRLKNMIVVSRLLERRFESRAGALIRIAAPVDIKEFPLTDNTHPDRLVLLYAGMAGRKDRLLEFLLAISSLEPRERARVEFRLLGPTKQELTGLLGASAPLLDLLADCVKPLGRVPRSAVLPILQQAHFSVLLRPHLRYANAGFPSKVAESLASGTPVMLNFTSDLAEYLSDGTAAMIIGGCTTADVTNTIRRALRLSPDELRQLRHGARLKAQHIFDYRNCLHTLPAFIEKLR
jgi:glycosyltransferase involved in cell wall biosynthesis